jgi:hypothetical protein
MLCTSCKNKTSTERCSARALRNLQFCGRHAKSKNVRLWKDVNSVEPGVIRIQKIWRGWLVRHLLKLAGPGVLKRSMRHNEEDVVTSEENVHPFDYFSFYEDDKVFWFDIRSIFQLSLSKLLPINPYTRQRLTLETRKRMKECIYYREVRKLPLFHDPLYTSDPEKVFEMTWMIISQTIEESLYVDINPLFFTGLNKTQLWEFTALLRDKLLFWAKEHSGIHSRRNIYYIWINNCWRRQTFDILASSKEVCYYLGKCILRILKNCRNPTDMCLKILSARHCL